MADSDRNGIPNGLNRIRTRQVPSEDLSSSGGDDSPAIAAPANLKGQDVDDRKGFRKGRKIARWLSSHLNPKDSCKLLDKVPPNIEVKVFDAKNQRKKASRVFKHSIGESSPLMKTSATQKSFSHELGPRGGIKASDVRARSYSDLKELLGSLHSKFDSVKEAVNEELDAFAGDVSDAIQKGSLSKEQETAENLLNLSHKCTEMTPSQFKENCESIVHHLAERRMQCKSGLVKQLLTRLLFILTRCTRLLQFQKDSGPINEESLVRFKQCIENVPAVDTKWVHKSIKAGVHKTSKNDFGTNSIQEDRLPKHPLKHNSTVNKEVLPSKAGDNISHRYQIEDDLQNELLCETSLDKLPEQEESDMTPIDSVLCRICEENVPASHLESHSYICAYADKCDLEGLDVDDRLLNISVILEQIVESYNQSWLASGSSPEISRIQSVNSVHGSEGQSPKVQEWHNKGMEGMFEDIHEMDTAGIDDPHIAASNNLKSILALKLGSYNPKSSNGSMTPGSSTTTPRSSHFDLFWLEHTNPSEPEDVNQMNELADIARRVAHTDLSKEGASEYLEMCLRDLRDILQHNQLKALVIDTFGSRIKGLLKEKHQLCVELMGKQSQNMIPRLDKISNVTNPSPYKISDSPRPLHKERTSIDDFKIIKPISRGAFGKVFLARKRTTGDLFAIKVLRKLDMIRKNDIERILAERNILITVRNPFVVRFFYSFTCRENLYLVMEYLNGGDLYSLLRKVGCLEEDVARIYVAELVCTKFDDTNRCSQTSSYDYSIKQVLALEYLHSLGIIHRDLKPDNILIARDGHIKLTDFGLSKIGLIDRAIDLSASGTAGSVLLKAQNIHEHRKGKRSRSSAVGTPDYLAPEILLGTAHGYAADWWSVGIILFELITGIPPFTARLPEMIFDNILNRKIPWPRVPDDMSYEAKDLIDRLLNQDQDLRLGANGASEVKSHPFFKEIDWDNLALQKAAFIPQPDSIDDTSYFMSRHSSISTEVPVDENSSDCGSDASKSSSTTVTETNMDAYNELKEFNSRTSLDLSSINFSFKNLSQLASMNYDALLQSGRNSKCSSPSQAPSS